MSLLFDPPLLVAGGAATARLLPDGSARRRVRTAAVAVFWATSVPLYLDARGIGPLPRLVHAESGRDFMLRSWVLPIDHRRVGWRTHLVAAAIVASYPLWWRLGERLAAGTPPDPADLEPDARQVSPAPAPPPMPAPPTAEP